MLERHRFLDVANFNTFLLAFSIMSVWLPPLFFFCHRSSKSKCVFFVIDSSVRNNYSVFAPALSISFLRSPRRFNLTADEQTLPPETRVTGVPEPEDEEFGLLPRPVPPAVLRGPPILASADGLGDGG
jgi:hypothetical protein